MPQTPSERERFEVLLEDVRHELQVVAEGHSTMDAKIDRTAKESAERDQALGHQMTLGFETVMGALQDLSTQLQSHERTHAS